jgi:hypothetical protein
MQKDTKVQSGAFNRAANPNQWQFVGGWWWWLVVAAGSAWWRGLMAIGWLAQQWRSIGAMVAHKRRIDGAANAQFLRA